MVGKLAVEGMASLGRQREEQGIHVCRVGALHHLGVDDAHVRSDENPRILSVLSSMLERALSTDRVATKELASTKNQANHPSKFGYASANYRSCVKASTAGRNSHQAEIMNDCKQKLSAFNGIRAPSIGVESYLQRIHKYARCSPCCFVLAYAYICKLLSSCSGDDFFISTELQSTSLLTSFNIHRLLITSIMLAAKFIDDSHYNNAYFAKIGGVSTVEINGLEMTFLKLIGYRLYINPDLFEKLCLEFSQQFAKSTTWVRLPPPPHPQCSSALLICSFDEEKDRKVALKCNQCTGV